MTEHTPPPERPMDDATRARIRARLAEETSRDGGPPVGRWLVPVGAAAAVVLIAVTAAYAAFWPGGSDAPPGPAASQSPASETPSAAPSSPLASLSPSLRASRPPTEPAIPPPADDATLSQPPGGAVDRCAQVVAEQVRGAEQVVSWELPGGPAGIWVAGDRSVFCEHSGGVSTRHQVRPTEASAEVRTEQLRFSTASYLASGDREVASFIAGGPLPQGVTGLDYRFPDGHEEPAVIRADDEGRRWWAMAYVTDGRLAAPGVNYLDLDPVQVVVSRSGVQETFTLRWGRDECAQANHGC